MMKTSILICGLNGSGKTTLGKALANKLGFHFIDSEDLFFDKTPSGRTYQLQRSYQEAMTRLIEEIHAYPNFIFASVKVDVAQPILSSFKYILLLEVPKDIRLQRIKARSFEQFGSRILPGGDLFKSEENFFNMVTHRSERDVEDGLVYLDCDIIRLDGTKPINENIEYIIKKLL